MSKRYYRSQPTGGEAAAAGCLVLALMLLFVVLGALVLMVAWNIVVPSVFGGPSIDLPQAIGLSILLGIIRSLLSR